ncbi:MAG: glycosyltransferase [Sulfolobales archaeon]
MKILYITGLYPPPETANGIRAFYFVRELMRSGYDVTVLETVSRADPSVGGFFGEKVIRIPLRSRRRLFRAGDIIYKVFFMRRIIKNMFPRDKPEIIVATWPSHEAIVLGGLLSKDLGASLVVDIQDLSDYYSEINDGILSKAIDPLYRFIYDIISKAEKIVTVTEPFRKILELRIGRKDIEVIYNGADTELYREAIENIHGFERRNPPIGVFVGDLNWRYHMLDRFIEALAILKRRGFHTKLKIVGTGALANKYRELVNKLGVNDLVSFEGYLERRDLVRTLITSDYGIIGRPSINSLWIIASARTTLYEYMAAGLPIFAFGPIISYTKSLLKINKCGYYIGSDNPLDIAENLARFLEIIGEFDRKAIHQRSYRYSWSNLAKQFTIILKNI